MYVYITEIETQLSLEGSDPKHKKTTVVCWSHGMFWANSSLVHGSHLDLHGRQGPTEGGIG